MHLQFLLFSFLFIAPRGLNGLKNVSLLINPSEVRRGQQAILMCLYDLEGDALLSVKWYRGQREFYRVSPNESATPKVFPFEGINVDESKSNASQVVLRQVGFSLSGNISCEVTVEKKFITAVAFQQMSVVELPEKAPTLVTDKNKYFVNDTLIANCTSSPSVPPASLSFLLNNIPVGSPKTNIFQMNSKQWSVLLLNITLTKEHFSETNQLILKCTALVSSYRQTTTVKLPQNANEPIPERVRSFGSNKTNKNQSNYFFIIFHIFVIIAVYIF